VDDGLIGMRMATRVAALAILVATGCLGGSANESGTSEGGSETGGTETGGTATTCDEGENTIERDGFCYCMPGTSWVDPFDPNSFDCAPIEPRPGACDDAHSVSLGGGLCSCEPLYTWCEFDPAYEMPTDDTVFDISCCLDPAQDPGDNGTSSTETTSGETTSGETTTGEAGESTGMGTSTDTSTG